MSIGIIFDPLSLLIGVAYHPRHDVLMISLPMIAILVFLSGEPNE